MQSARKSLKSMISNYLVKYLTPSNLNYFWRFIFLAGICLVLHIVPGVVLVLYHAPEVQAAGNGSYTYIQAVLALGEALIDEMDYKRFFLSNCFFWILIVIYLPIERKRYIEKNKPKK